MCVQIIIKPLIILIDKFLIFSCKKIFEIFLILAKHTKNKIHFLIKILQMDLLDSKE